MQRLDLAHFPFRLSPEAQRSHIKLGIVALCFSGATGILLLLQPEPIPFEGLRTSAPEGSAETAGNIATQSNLRLLDSPAFVEKP